MLITKVGLTVLLASAGLGLPSASLPPSEMESPQLAQSTGYEQLAEAMAIDYLAGAQVQF